MFSKDLHFLPTIVGDLIDKTEEIKITPLKVEEQTMEAIDIDVSDFDESNWWKELFEEDDGFDGYGSIMYLETELSFEDILYFSTEQEIKDLVAKYDYKQLKDAFFEIYYLYVKMIKETKEKAKMARKER